MASNEEKFASDLIAQAPTHEAWLMVVRFGLGSLITNQTLLVRILVDEAKRTANANGDVNFARHLKLIMGELDLKLTIA